MPVHYVGRVVLLKKHSITNWTLLVYLLVATSVTCVVYLCSVRKKVSLILAEILFIYWFFENTSYISNDSDHRDSGHHQLGQR